MATTVAPLKWPGFVVNMEGASPKSRKQTLLMTPSGPMVTSSLGSSGMSKLDLEMLQKQMSDPRHRYDTVRSAANESSRLESARTNTTTADLREPPSWIRHDRQVLRFYGYFQELCHESAKEMDRARMCFLYFYLEDGTMMITEPREENSGLPQGCVIKRHKVPNGRGDGYYTPEDLGTGQTISIYSRPFHIYDCDGFTRGWYTDTMNKALVQESPPNKLTHIKAGVPKVKSKEYLEQKEYYEMLFGANAKNQKMQQFLDNDKRVLRFKCFSDDNSKYFLRIFFTLYYYLADDTLELIEVPQKNRGRIPEKGVFWKRAMLLKNPHYSCAPCMTGPEPVPTTAEDLIVGQAIVCQGRTIFIYDCDEFTREFYKELGIEQDKMIVEEPEMQWPEATVPPHNGFGTEEDSLGNCRGLLPKAPKQDINKLLQDAGKVLRFEGEMVTNNKEDQARRFIVATYVADNHVAVWEIKNPNYGHAQGKFAAKARKKNPATGDWFAPKDFYVGAVVEINAARFKLVAADEMAIAHMERNSIDFPCADSRTVALKLMDFVNELTRFEEVEMPQQKMMDFCKERKIPMNQHECMTLARCFATSSPPASDGPIYLMKLVMWLRKEMADL